MNRGSTELVERYGGEAWIDSIQAALNAQTDFFVSSLRWWGRLSMGLAATQAEVAGSTAGATKTAVGAVAEARASAGEAATTRSESISRTLTDQARRHREQAPIVALDALSVEHLDRLAAANDLENYPQSGSKSEKIAALEVGAVGLTSAN
jgi:hypothetical protein